LRKAELSAGFREGVHFGDCGKNSDEADRARPGSSEFSIANIQTSMVPIFESQIKNGRIIHRSYGRINSPPRTSSALREDGNAHQQA
jgi:hypothetical protein